MNPQDFSGPKGSKKHLSEALYLRKTEVFRFAAHQKKKSLWERAKTSTIPETFRLGVFWGK